MQNLKLRHHQPQTYIGKIIYSDEHINLLKEAKLESNSDESDNVSNISITNRKKTSQKHYLENIDFDDMVDTLTPGPY